MQEINQYRANVPDEMKELNQWGVYRKIWQPERNKYTKIPIDANTGGAGKSNDESTWSDFETALKALNEIEDADGLAFYFANGYVGLDVDHIKDDLDSFSDGNDDPDNLVNIVRKLTNQTYLEVSLSGEGIHAIFKGKIPGKRRRKGNFEMYESGRFFALTANTIGKTKIETLDETNLKALYYFVFGKDETTRVASTVPYKNNLSISEIIDKAETSKNGARFRAFMQGGWEPFYASHSEADLAFANDLAFWTGKDYAKMDAIFRQSNLMREKFDRKEKNTTYGDNLLNKAIEEAPLVYRPGLDDYHVNMPFLKAKEPEKLLTQTQDDTGNAKRFMQLFGDKFKYSYTDKVWFYYNDSFWERDTKGYLEKAIDKMIDAMKTESVPFAGDEEDKEKAKQKFLKFIAKTRNHASKENLAKELRHYVPVIHGEFDKQEFYLNTPSGYVDLRDGSLHDHQEKLMFSQETGVEYTDNADCPRWLKFIDQIFNHDQDLIKYVQRLVGYSLTGSNREQEMYICIGKGRNGKSVFLNILQTVFGIYAKTMDVNSIMANSRNNDARSDLARLEGARMVVSSEANEGDRLDESILKQITGGDRLVVRYMYGNEFEFIPKFKLWMATNHKPVIRGVDDGIWRRIKIIPFSVQIPKEKVDKDLKEKLLKEARGILNWCVEGAILYSKYGLGELPQSMKLQNEDYREEMNVVEQFIDEMCTKAPELSERASSLFEAYKSWAEKNDEQRLSKRLFSQRLKELYSFKRTKAGIYYQGLKLGVYDYGGLKWNKQPI